MSFIADNNTISNKIRQNNKTNQDIDINRYSIVFECHRIEIIYAIDYFNTRANFIGIYSDETNKGIKLKFLNRLINLQVLRKFTHLKRFKSPYQKIDTAICRGLSTCLTRGISIHNKFN